MKDDYTDRTGFLWPETLFVVQNSEGQIPVLATTLEGDMQPRSYVHVFTDEDLARTFLEDRPEPRHRIVPISRRNEFGNILRVCETAGIARVAIDPTAEQTKRRFQVREIASLREEFPERFAWGFPCYLMETDPPGGLACIQAKPSNYIGVFSSEEKCVGYMKLRNQVPRVRRFATPKELAAVLRRVPDEVANACLFDPDAETGTRRMCIMRTEVVRVLDAYVEPPSKA